MRFTKILAACFFAIALSPVRSEEPLPSEIQGWEYDSISPTPSPEPNPTSIDEIRDAIFGMVAAWNGHDLDAYVDHYWRSPQLLLIVDSEQFFGWDDVQRTYLNSYADRSSMGFMETPRLRIKMLKPDLAFALAWWQLTFQKPTQKIYGTSTMIIQKFDEGWKITTAHTHFIEP
jgi:ketosteroid isomerase-like protein